MDSLDRAVPAGIVLMADPRVAAVPVHEVGGELLDVRDCEMLRVSSFRADAEGAFAHVRMEVLDRLVGADDALADGLRLLIVEGYRPPAVQRRYFREYRAVLRDANPDWSEDRLQLAASRYVSPPEIAPHSAGAAVDLTLCTAEGVELDLGSAVNATPEESAGACYTDHPGLSAEAKHYRAVLAASLTGAGFVNYPTEWWHWSYGDRYWALATGAPAALYGSLDRP
ncbi:D-alanyl-D-alanine carboxypeptidase family protein [Actinospica durhamensis]|uniref:D-alanyl-D-alanine dipeptidase n=1 Tax=Actinospica durhamensis TaxID=1508375 RepID=A0A941IVK5_9ACTN|nr:M15 family metallopeptidase [Actinospica durhamensis]MBR7839548.1 D-alanyl-D-alanine carboxypeptidase family protein [Actinospica durhamensis]